MPYIDSETVKVIRTRIKKEIPEFKFSVTCKHCSVVKVVILKGPIEFDDDYVQVNEFYYERNYKDQPEAVALFKKILDIIEDIEPARTVTVDGDYGNIPNYYIHLRVGEWDKPYIKAAA